MSERLATLYRITRGECDVVLVAAQTALYRLPPPSYLAAHTFFLTQGETLDVEALRAQLALAGYSHVTQVVSPGEFSVRGGLIDLFPMGSALPYRLDLFGDDIESIKTFDVDTQRTLYPVPNVRLLPAREFPLDDDGRTRFRSRFREVFEGDPTKSPLYKDISNGIAPGGIEYYLPLFFDATAAFTDYLPADSADRACTATSTRAADRFWQDTDSRYKLLRGDKARPLLPPNELFLAPDAFRARAEAVRAHRDCRSPTPTPRCRAMRRSAGCRRCRSTAAPTIRCVALKRSVDAHRRPRADRRREPRPTRDDAAVLRRVRLPSGARRRLRRFRRGRRQGRARGGPAGSGLRVARGAARVHHRGRALRERRATRGKRDAAPPPNVDAMVRDLSEVRIGDPVVHEEHGIGRYLGLVTLDVGDGDTEFLQLIYANDAKLYVPVSNLHLISRYSGASPEAAPLHELGSAQWEKAKRKAAQQAHDTAAELLNLYAQRAARQGHAFTFNAHDYEAFAEGFGFEETPDQQAAIEAVIADLA